MRLDDRAWGRFPLPSENFRVNVRQRWGQAPRAPFGNKPFRQSLTGERWCLLDSARTRHPIQAAAHDGAREGSDMALRTRET